MTSRFSDQILKVMNVSGYHAGDNILVEIDVGRAASLHTHTHTHTHTHVLLDIMIRLFGSPERENPIEGCT